MDRGEVRGAQRTDGEGRSGGRRGPEQNASLFSHSPPVGQTPTLQGRGGGGYSQHCPSDSGAQVGPLSSIQGCPGGGGFRRQPADHPERAG